MSSAFPRPTRRRVAVVTGSRAEFGLLERTVIQLLRAPWCEMQLIAAGMHLDPKLGSTLEEVEAKFVVSARVDIMPPEDTRQGMALAVADGLRGFTEVFSALKPDLVLVLGDRTEVFAASLAASYLTIPIVHIHGGDVTGNAIDNFQRDVISKLARVHLAATERSVQRLRKLGGRH